MLICQKLMNSKTIVSLVIIVLFLGGLIWWSKAAETSELTKAQTGQFHPARTGAGLTASETFYDFGTISMKNGNVSKKFKITNSSGADIKVPNVGTSCMCTVAYILKEDGTRKGPYGMPGHGAFVPKANEVIKAGESREIEVVYDPNAHGPAGVGLIERSVFLEDETGKVTELSFKVNVTP